ncbi:hypothetical protein ACROAG_14700 [Shewanella oncorhynchi]|uniref:hypothetical protein n=1 Tax=Shewanella oncorhynchi TaxID=2726434 RepID=UPI003D7B12E6
MIMKILLTILLLLPMSFGFCFTLNGTVANGQLTWDNIVSSQGQNTLSTWSPQSGLTPTTKWRPGFMASPQPLSSITLSNGGNTITFPLTITGIEYNAGSNSIADVIDNPGTQQICDTSIAFSNVVHLAGTGNCTYNKLINNGVSKTPFFFLRPLFYFDEAALLELFYEKPKGQYSGVIPFTIRYYYYSSSGALTYRDIRQSFAIQIFNNPSYISTVVINGGGVLVPVYDKIQKTVSATTDFQVNATGNFDKGMKMILQDRTYHLSSLTLTNTIPYSISCVGAACTDIRLVSGGVLSLPEKSTILNSVAGNKKNIAFVLNVSYENIAAANVESGIYTDSFTILFEADF